MQKLPIGIQTFSEIREQNYFYIDKTELALNLIENNKYSFLSRPRRFGKSLFLDTLHNIFEGKKEYFKGLAIEDKWDFEDVYPVIKIDWAGDFKTLESTNKVALKILQENQERLEIECDEDNSPSDCFRDLIRKSYQKYNKPVVILIDEYDKPILDNLEDTKRALENRDFLRSFYVMMKANDAYIKFAFLTGISKFSKASIFSGLNNLEDISLTPKYGNICGYTQANIENEFLPYLKDVDLERVKEWYNGYNFLGDKVYNPFDILRFIKNDLLFKNYWWESGNPYFLITLLKEKNYNLADLENITVGDELLNSFEVDKMRLEVLLFQAGYLTIEEQLELPFGGYEYRLKVPNKEVQMSLNNLFLEYLLDDVSNEIKKSIYFALMQNNLEAFKETFVSLFASIPYNNYVGNKIEEYEGYYASVFYAYLAASGLHIVAEDVTNQGRIDLTLILEDKIYIIEFKVGSDDALRQIKEKKYAQKYLNQNKEIYLLGINFSKESKNIEKFEWDVAEM
jgi:hypothetical protein